ncbi:homoserine kinase [Stygiolobus caldivivus]|uniref:Homoserine kinase n=1 Tax=Stygiolobus caldivivus TaxID=2824673 RepID=A0A8D5U4A1_9CREN|nr:homoserine kinase [Stygiolobus caldivivus]BCU69004.1 homoserine kinase [Stygiolobus caldivivus]
MSEKIIAKAFSSSANLGAGFDILAMAHDAFYDSVEITSQPSSSLQVYVEGEGVPNIPEQNSASFALIKLLEEFNIKAKLKVKVNKGIPPGLGMGSSGASSSAAVVAANELFKLELSNDDLVKFSMLGEIAASGSPHPDNVAASVVGGVVAVVSSEPVRVVQIPVNLPFSLILFIPKVNIEAKTKKAREMVPKHVELQKLVKNSRYLSSLLIGLIKGDRELVRTGLNDDIVEKAREPLFPYYSKLKEVALNHNAIGACVSGAGPTIAVFVDEKSDKAQIIKDGLKICESYGYECSVKEAKIARGAWIEGRN